MKEIELIFMRFEGREKHPHGRLHPEKYTYSQIHDDSICSLYGVNYILRTHIVWITKKTYGNCRV
jgi:hypothetical protein